MCDAESVGAEVASFVLRPNLCVDWEVFTFVLIGYSCIVLAIVWAMLLRNCYARGNKGMCFTARDAERKHRAIIIEGFVRISFVQSLIFGPNAVDLEATIYSCFERCSRRTHTLRCHQDGYIASCNEFRRVCVKMLLPATCAAIFAVFLRNRDRHAL